MADSPNRQLALFLLLTWAISWPLWYASGVLTREGDLVFDGRWLVAQIGVFAPSLSALIVSGLRSHALRMNGLRILPLFGLIFLGGIAVASVAPGSIREFTPTLSILVVGLGVVSILFVSPLNRRLLLPATGQVPGKTGAWPIILAILGGPLLFLVGWFLVNFPGKNWSVDAIQNGLTGFVALLATAFCMNLILGGSMGEELGWRGFVLPLLLKKFPPLGASLALGILWGCWHFPIDLSHPPLVAAGAVIFRFAWTFPLSIIFTWFYLKSGGNLLVALLLHTSVNVLPDLGFSMYEPSILALTFILVIIAFSLTRLPLMRKTD